MQKNPFKYGSAVSGRDFINRDYELAEVLHRLSTGQSSTIIGEPHIGKTSFLLQLREPKIQIKHVGYDVAKRWSFSPLSSLHYDKAFNPTKFWDIALKPIEKHPGNRVVSRLLKEAQQARYYGYELQLLFEALKAQKRLLIVFLDEFESLLTHNEFQDPGFFGTLRDLSSYIGGLALVVSSRFTHTRLNEIGASLLNPGSPYINHALPIRIELFDEKAVEKLLRKASPRFSLDEKIFIRRVAGQNPYLLQAMAGTLYMTPDSENRVGVAADKFYEHVGDAGDHFGDLWKYLNESERTVAVMLAVMTLQGRALGTSFSFGEIERVDRFGLELRRLAKKGLAEMIGSSRRGWIFDSEYLLVWRGEKWAIGSEAFAWWVRDNVIAPSRNVLSNEEWLQNQRYVGLITQKQWDEIKETVHKLPSWAVRSVAGLARALWDEIRVAN